MDSVDPVRAHGIGFDEGNSNPLSQQDSTIPWVAETSEETVVPVDQAATIATAKARARIVLEKFRRQRSMLMDPSNTAAISLTIGVENERRQRWLVREGERIQAALFKNLDRLLDRDKANLARLDKQVSTAADLERATSSHYETLLERRRQKLLGFVPATNKGKKQTFDHTQASSTTHSVPKDGVAVYISGLGESNNEDMLRSLFGAFGEIRRIHLYRDKATAALKGDGLVIYEMSTSKRPQILLENVCGQVSSGPLSVW